MSSFDRMPPASTAALRHIPGKGFAARAKAPPPAHQHLLHVLLGAAPESLGPYLEEFRSLAKEPNPQLFFGGLLNLGIRLEQADRVALAAELYGTLASEAPLPLRKLAQQRLNALGGTGSSGFRVEMLLRRLAQESMEPATLLGMGAASAAFKLTRLATLCRLAATPATNFLTRGLGAQALAGLAGFGVEGAVFPLATRLGHITLGRSLDWSPQQLGRELAGSYLVLGALKLSGWGAATAANRVHGVAREVGARHAVPLRSGFAQAGMLAGIYLGHQAETVIGLRPRLDNATTLVDSLGMLFQFNVAGHLTGRALSGQFHALEQTVGAVPAKKPAGRREPPPSKAVVPGLIFATATPPMSVLRRTIHQPSQRQIFMVGNNGDGEGPPSSGVHPSVPPDSRPIPKAGEPVSTPPPETPKIQEFFGEAASQTDRDTLPPESGWINPQEGVDPFPPTLRYPMPFPLFEVEWASVFRFEDPHWIGSGVVKPDQARRYGEATGNWALTRSNFAPAALPFLAGFAEVRRWIEAILLKNPQAAVIHANEAVEFYKPLRQGDIFHIELSHKIVGRTGKRQVVDIKAELFSIEEGSQREKLATASTTLLVESQLKKFKSLPVAEAELRKLPPLPVLELLVTPEHIGRYSEVSGDYNPIHTDDAAAQAHGLPGRIAHGMWVFNQAERALFLADPNRDPSQPPRFQTEFRGMVRPEDQLSFFVEPFEVFEPIPELAQGVSRIGRAPKPKVLRAGNRVTVLNQRNELVLRLLDETPGETLRRVQSGDQVTWIYRNIDYSRDDPAKQRVSYQEIPIDAAAGIRRVDRIVEKMQASLRLYVAQEPDQFWANFGVSDGFGLYVSAALLDSGLLRHGLGVFYEPPMLLRRSEPVFIERMENIEGLRNLAARRGADFPIFYHNAVLPQVDGSVRALSPAVLKALEVGRARSGIPDVNLINAVAFATFISPLPGVKTSPWIPTLNLRKGGVLEFVETKVYDEEAAKETLIAMGYNHGALLEALENYFGPRSLSLLPTWALGSQNIEILAGIYGGGVLGLAKQIAENAALDFHLKSRAKDYALGHHKVLRLPAFNSRALWAIPSGPQFGLTSWAVLEESSSTDGSLYQDLHSLAPRALAKVLGGPLQVHQRAHPLAQIELDAAEHAHIGEINWRMLKIYERIADEIPGYREAFLTHYGRRWDGITFDLKLIDKIPDFAMQYEQHHGRPYNPKGAFFDMAVTRRTLRGSIPDDWIKMMPGAEE